MVFLLAFYKVYAKQPQATIHPIHLYEGKTSEYVYMLVNVFIEKFRYIITTKVYSTGAPYEDRHCLSSTCVSDAGLRVCHHASVINRHRPAGSGR
ncbi:hypothetical protein CRH15_13625 [Lelliottia amnigena]|nr:hypothetical protein CO697_02595 [Lelliottia amnigena]PEG64280.1 hypothetical protein CRH15_13625 [Lelliottia amnigena]